MNYVNFAEEFVSALLSKLTVDEGMSWISHPSHDQIQICLMGL
jgi:hypothetical protein